MLVGMFQSESCRVYFRFRTNSIHVQVIDESMKETFLIKLVVNMITSVSSLKACDAAKYPIL